MTLGLLEGVLDALAGLPAPLLHLAVAALAFSETALFLDLLVPGEVGMVLAGAAAHRAGVGVPGLIAAGSIGATLGDSASYVLGRLAAGGRLPGAERILRHVDANAGHSFFERHGGVAVLFGRFVGALRAAVPFAAGVAGMPYRRFLAWNVLASIAWVTAVVVLGATLGEAVAGVVDRVSGWLSLAVLAAGAAFVLRRRHRRDAVTTAVGAAAK